ncbi:hypothetical protein [Arsenophonus sp. ENCA]|uniref:hypothetical protein n=1 Tax=Arsenophonus sp. ENCA TaxID=1987579 RepID=UPI0025BFE3BE|nr:hypothetical protein [Arsenophonus sp. ENCA]
MLGLGVKLRYACQVVLFGLMRCLHLMGKSLLQRLQVLRGLLGALFFLNGKRLT